MRQHTHQSTGQQLAERLTHLQAIDSVALALRPGSIALGTEVARLLHLPFDMLFVHRLAHPYYQDRTVGAVAENDEPFYDEDKIRALTASWLYQAVAAARTAMSKQRAYYYHNRSALHLTGKKVLLIDDGTTDALVVEAAARHLQRQQPAAIVVATPAATAELVHRLYGTVSQLVAAAEGNAAADAPDGQQAARYHTPAAAQRFAISSMA